MKTWGVFPLPGSLFHGTGEECRTSLSMVGKWSTAETLDAPWGILGRCSPAKPYLPALCLL